MYLVKALRLFVGTNAERTGAGLAAFLPGDEYHETDTSDTYQHDGAAWIQKNTGGTPGGTDGQLQYNNGGAFGGDDALTWDKTDDILTIAKATMTPPTYSPFTAVALHNGDITLVSDPPATLSLEWRVAGEAAADPRAKITYNSTTNALDFRTDGAMNFITAGGVYVWQFFSGAVNVNPQGGDIDFFVESDTYPFMLNVDAGADLVTIGTASQGTIAQFGNDGIVFNEEGADRDHRFEGNTATHLLVTDGGTDTVQIGTTVAGSIASFGPSAIVLNNGEADRNFRIAGNGVANGIFYDAGNNRTGFGTTTPAHTVQVSGDGDIFSASTKKSVTDGVASVFLVGDSPGGNFGSYAGIFNRTTSLSSVFLFRVGDLASDGAQISLGTAATQDENLYFTMRQTTNNNVMRFTTTGNIEGLATTGTFVINSLTTTQRNALTAVNGMILYNSTTGKFQGRAGGVWVDLH